MDRNINLLIDGIKNLGLDISKEQENQFINYYELLIKSNKVMNLTAITEFNDVMVKHFLDSISIIKVMDLNNINEIIDVGTGAGFPGIPIKIMFPQLHLVLMDSLGKRVKFLEETCFLLGLRNVDAIHSRAEDLAKNVKYREKFDVCVSRAVANLATLSEYCIPFVKVGGYFISYKSGNSKDEINNAKSAINKLSGALDICEEFTIPNTDMSRILVKVKKINKTSNIYPRKAGIPAREPLK